MHSQRGGEEENIKEEWDKITKAHVYHTLGVRYHELRNFEKARKYNHLHLSNAEDAGDKNIAYANLGSTYFAIGDFEKAREYYQKQLDIAKGSGDRAGEGGAYCNLGSTCHTLGDPEKALEYYQLYLDFAKGVRDKAGEAKAYHGLGAVYHSLSNFEKAVEYHQLHFSISKDIGDKAGQGKAYHGLGSAYLAFGDLDNSLKYHNLHLSIAKDVGDKVEQGKAYDNLAIIYQGRRDFEASFEFLQRALSIQKDVGDKAGQGRTYNGFGIYYAALGDFKTALEYHQQSLSIARDVGDNVLLGDAYRNLGGGYVNLGDFEKALEYHQLSLSIAKDVGDKCLLGKAYCGLGCAYVSLGDLEKAAEYVQLLISIAKDVGDKDGEGAAFFLLGSAYCSGSDLSKAEDFFKSSVRELNNLRNLHSKDDWKIGLRDNRKDVYDALWMVQLAQNKPFEALFSAERGRAQALMDLMESKYDLKLVQCESLSDQMDTISDASFIPSQTVFLAVASNFTHFWVIKNGKECSCRRRELKRDDLQFLLDRALSKKFAQKQYKSLKALYDMIISPIADLIDGDEITIVPDGPLFLVPFAALMDPHSKYVSETYRIRLIPSLTSLKLLAECPEGYHCTTGALLVGDPYLKNIYEGELETLPGAKEEAIMIGRILNVKPLIGKEATKAAVLSGLNSVALVHIASHGSGSGIYFSPNPTSLFESPNEEDYNLTSEEVLNAEVKAQLVVLSCCHSGCGEIKAEGVVGLARAFLGAGARSVVVTLWAINDEGTLEFMKHFYRHVVKGQSVSKCLDQAMKCLRESEKFSDVGYWAPFALFGDDVTMNFPGAR